MAKESIFGQTVSSKRPKFDRLGVLKMAKW